MAKKKKKSPSIGLTYKGFQNPKSAHISTCLGLKIMDTKHNHNLV